LDNCHGLVVNTRLTQASGKAEPAAALAIAVEIAGQGRVTLGSDKGYDRAELVQELREHHVTPHFAPKQSSIIDQRAPPGIRATRLVSASANSWKRSSAGSRPWVGCARPAIVVSLG
jgi:IS5 family transposase